MARPRRGCLHLSPSRGLSGHGLDRLLGEVEEARQAAAPRQLGRGREEALALREPFGALLALQLCGMPAADGAPAGGDLCGGGGAILAAKQGEAGGGDRLLVQAWRDEQEGADRGAPVELGLGDRAGEDGRVGEQQPAALRQPVWPRSSPYTSRRSAAMRSLPKRP